MTPLHPDLSQQQAARLAGVSLLLLIITGLLGNFIFTSGLVVENDPAGTARNITSHETRFRMGILFTLLMLNCDIVEAVALYILLRPVHRSLALLSACWRLANAFISGALGFTGFLELKLAAGSSYLSNLSTDQQQSFMLLFINTDGEISLIGLLFFGFGMAMTGYLFVRSGYIPRFLSGFYLFSSLVLLTGTIALLAYPKSGTYVNPAFIIPDFLAELSMAIWLIVKGVRLPVSHPTPT